tara:strand:- start:370 stop:606 length:237 start_codon:yes stop_codon:yes gene_type:complete
MDTFEIITTLRKRLHGQLQTIGDSLMDGVDNMEKYKYLVGQAHAIQIALQEISNLLKDKEQKNEKGTIVDISGRNPKK